MKLNKEFCFLTSTRFYGNLLISTGYWLQLPDPFMPESVGKLLVVFGGLFVSVRTIDRFAEKIGLLKPGNGSNSGNLAQNGPSAGVLNGMDQNIEESPKSPVEADLEDARNRGLHVAGDK